MKQRRKRHPALASNTIPPIANPPGARSTHRPHAAQNQPSRRSCRHTELHRRKAKPQEQARQKASMPGSHTPPPTAHHTPLPQRGRTPSKANTCPSASLHPPASYGQTAQRPPPWKARGLRTTCPPIRHSRHEGYVSKSVSFLTPSCQVDPHKQVFHIAPARFQGVSESVSETPLTRLVRHHFSAKKLPRDGNRA